MNKEELLKAKLETGGTLEEYLHRLPERWQSKTIEAASECLKRKWPLHELSIQAIALETTPEDLTKTQKAEE